MTCNIQWMTYKFPTDNFTQCEDNTNLDDNNYLMAWDLKKCLN